MGPQRVLQAVAVVASAWLARPSLAAPRGHERIAVVDLGPDGTDVRQRLTAALVTAGFEPVSGDGVEEALAGRGALRDAAELALAMAAAQRAFGELKCSDVTPAAQTAVGLAAARQAAGLPVPELPRAWTYLLLCADRENRFDAAHAAAHQLRGLGGSPDVPAGVWAKYPAIDAIADLELIELDIEADVPGAAVWIDFQPAGVSPLHVALPAGDHVIAAAAGGKRGWAAGRAVRSQTSVHVALSEPAQSFRELAQRVASFHGAVPAPGELAWLLDQVHARIALVRHGDTVEAWGQIGRSELPHRLGDAAPIDDVARVLNAVDARIRRWADHAPDPDTPLLVESPEEREARSARGDVAGKPTKWWVYAAIAGAAAIGATIILVHDAGSDRQRVEVRYP
jgi:hypothetical protein